MTDATAAPLAAKWVFPQNVRPLASYLSHLVGYKFDEADWIAIEFGLAKSYSELGLWFRYPIDGEPRIELALAAETNAEPVHVQVRSDLDVDLDLLIRIETTLSIFNSFDMR